MTSLTFTILFYSIRGLIVIGLLIFGWREVALLFRRPAGNMGTGLSRVWAVGRTTMLEAWAGRIWLLPILWLGMATILIYTVRPFDESERIPLYIRMLLSSQELLLLVMVWVMACVSLPRERERKILVTNASKPLSRLEIVMGKIVGFSAVSGVLLVFMGLCSLGILLYSNHRLERASAEAYQIQSDDFAKQGGRAAGASAAAPSAALKRLADEGSLYAYNYITVPKHGMSIVGGMDMSQEPPIRYVKGGSAQRISYRFTRLEADDITMLAPTGMKPYFVFNFDVIPTVQPPPSKVQLQVSVVCTGLHGNAPPRSQAKTLTLRPDGYAGWEPENPDWFLSYRDSKTGELLNDAGEVTLDVICPTDGVMLQLREGADPDPKTQAIAPGATFNVVFIADRRKPETGIPHLAQPSVHGFERHERQEVAGPKQFEINLDGGRSALPEVAVFRFSGKDIGRIPLNEDHTFNISLLLDTFLNEHPETPTIARVMVQSLDTRGATPFSADLEVLEKRVLTLKVPQLYLGDPDPAKRGDMVVVVSSLTVGHSISFVEDSVRIELPQSHFTANLMKSEFVIFLEATMLIGISVVCSIRVGWPVAMLCSTVIVIFGYFVEFLATLPEYGGLGALNYTNPSDSSMYQFFDSVTLGIWKFLAVFATFVPNFTIYKPDEFISKLQNMPWSVLLGVTLSTFTFLVPIVALSFLLFRKQELG